MEVKISISNSKLGAQIPSINLPPEHSCRVDAPCHKGCYGKKGHFLFKNVKKSLLNNFACYVNNSEDYFNGVISFLNDTLISYKYFRWHSVGDIVDDTYFIGMIKVAKKCKNVKFLCFTKKFGIVNKYLASGKKNT